jgi:hypothetical protein
LSHSSPNPSEWNKIPITKDAKLLKIAQKKHFFCFQGFICSLGSIADDITRLY